MSDKITFSAIGRDSYYHREWFKKNGCKTIAQPSGSINDKKISSCSYKHKISLYFIQHSLFKH